MPIDEAGYIALHIHTAKLNSPEMQQLMMNTTIINEMVTIIKKELNMEIDETACRISGC